MTNQKHRRFLGGSEGPPDLLDHPIKEPLRETYQERWSQLPTMHKIYVIIVLGFCCLFIAVMVWNQGRPEYSTILMEVAFVTTILETFFLLLKRFIR
jgi:hypothetical protein